MSCTDLVKNGVVVMPPEAKPEEGAQVEVVPRGLKPEEDPSLAAVLNLAKPLPHFPNGVALNHGNYVSGEAKKLGSLRAPYFFLSLLKKTRRAPSTSRRSLPRPTTPAR